MEQQGNSLLDYIKKNYKTILNVLFILLTILSFVFGWFGYSLVIGLKTGNSKATIEFYDKCLDSLDLESELDYSSFTPKKPKYFVVHCTGSKADQTEADLWSVFNARFKNGKPGYNYAINFKGDVLNFAPIDNNGVLDWREVVNGVKNMNSVCISVAITGGYEENTITPAQLNTLRYVFLRFKQQFPDIQLTTHREISSKDTNGNGIIDPNERYKACPRFDKDTYFF